MYDRASSCLVTDTSITNDWVKQVYLPLPLPLVKLISIPYFVLLIT